MLTLILTSLVHPLRPPALELQRLSVSLSKTLTDTKPKNPSLFGLGTVQRAAVEMKRRHARDLKHARNVGRGFIPP